MQIQGKFSERRSTLGVGMLIMRKHDFSRRTQPSGQAGLVTEKSDQTGAKIFEFERSGSHLSLGRDLSLSHTSKNCIEPLMDLIWNYNAIYLYQTESILLLISCIQKFQFNLPETPVVDVL